MLTRHGVTHIVCRNSGGDGAYAKIEAAREMAVAVLMIAMPAIAVVQEQKTEKRELSGLRLADEPCEHGAHILGRSRSNSAVGDLILRPHP